MTKWCAKGASTNLVEFAPISAFVVTEKAGFGSVNVSVEEEAKSSNGQLFDQSKVSNAMREH
ncbi:hypothetical protein LYNGBM3L_59290 [Moorena producens 3L]|uniref:Uncharacterized protein n=2 Tax=Moorena producens TaxID=1155739 RepID=A0A1D9G293_MOOP1|nr:hypothetical protein LYNGBM3L_59290 [Moorena producens 3L]OLT66382.1 hypothetical protein BI334_16400 [Moorena producens 3L]